MTAKISILLPAHNEAACLPQVLDELVGIAAGLPVLEIIVIDDGSTDRTRVILEEYRRRDSSLKVVTLPLRQGKTAAIAAGVKAASGELIATQDADGEDDPKYLSAMLELLNSGQDLVSTRRKNRSHVYYKRWLSLIFNIAVKILLRIDVTDVNSGLKLGKKDVWLTIPLQRDFHRFIPVLAQHWGFRIAELEVEHRRRFSGQSKYGVDRYFKALIDLVVIFAFMRLNAGGKKHSRADKQSMSMNV
jgi:dolichol-phosphate mannosyltransferase